MCAVQGPLDETQIMRFGAMPLRMGMVGLSEFERCYPLWRYSLPAEGV